MKLSRCVNHKGNKRRNNPLQPEYIGIQLLLMEQTLSKKKHCEVNKPFILPRCFPILRENLLGLVVLPEDDSGSMSLSWKAIYFCLWTILLRGVGGNKVSPTHKLPPHSTYVLTTKPNEIRSDWQFSCLDIGGHCITLLSYFLRSKKIAVLFILHFSKKRAK